MRQKKTMMMVAVAACILLAVPLAKQYVFGQELRRVPGMAQPTLSSLDLLSTVPSEISENGEFVEAPLVSDYGYYSDDHWVEQKCGFYITTGAEGIIELSIYYPFEIKGDQTTHVFVNGQPYGDFTIESENIRYQIQTTPTSKVYVQINSDFAREPDEQDARRLSFVLSEVMTR